MWWYFITTIHWEQNGKCEYDDIPENRQVQVKIRQNNRSEFYRHEGKKPLTEPDLFVLQIVKVEIQLHEGSEK